MARLKSYAYKSVDSVMRSTQGSIRQQVKPRKQVRFAEDSTPEIEQDRPTKKAKSIQASIHQTVDGRVGKSYGSATTSSKDKRSRQSQVSRAIAAGESEDESESESEIESEREPEGSDERPQRGWNYHGLSRWTGTQEGEQEGTANANTNSPSARSCTIKIRHIDGTDHDFFVWGNALQESSRFFRAARSGRWTPADVPTIVEEDVKLFEKFLLAIHDWEEFKADISAAIAASKLHPTDGDEVSPEKRRKREETFEALIGVYILADKYEDLVGANRILDELIRFSHKTKILPHFGAVDQAYKLSPEGSRLRMLLRDIYVHESSFSALEAVVRNDVHPDFTADVALEYCQLRNDHPNGHINKWFNQAVASRPKGYYHQELPETSPEERGVELVGNFIEIVRVVELTEAADEGSQSGGEISRASTALLQAIEESS
ncbi:hypothetical protein MBLNU13_g02124t1 [Cladosporium sp. NU13]